jgi:hypothetical protein
VHSRGGRGLYVYVYKHVYVYKSVYVRMIFYYFTHCMCRVFTKLTIYIYIYICTHTYIHILGTCLSYVLCRQLREESNNINTARGHITVLLRLCIHRPHTPYTYIKKNKSGCSKNNVTSSCTGKPGGLKKAQKAHTFTVPKKIKGSKIHSCGL